MYKYQTQWKYLLFEVTDDFNQGLHLVDLVVYFYNMKTVLGLHFENEVRDYRLFS